MVLLADATNGAAEPTQGFEREAIAADGVLGERRRRSTVMASLQRGEPRPSP